MEILCTYSESRLDGKRKYTLLKNEMCVSGTANISSRFEVSVPLRSLTPSFNKLWIQHPFFSWFLAVDLLSIVALVTLISRSASNDIVGPLTAFTVATAAGAIATFRKVEYAQFVNHDGIPLLLIARSGNNSQDFDAFVSATVTQIEKANEKTA